MLLKTITYKNTTFYQNKGSQNFVLKQIKNDKSKALIHIHSSKNGRMWGAINKTDILKWIKKNIGLYEVITSYPCKVYFDIDGADNEDVNLEDVKNIIRKYFGDDVKMAISGYKTNDKSSFHICLFEYAIKNIDELDELKSLVLYIKKNEHSAFDWKVYTQNRYMKAINQSKIKKPVQKIIEDEDETHHLITFYLETIKYELPNFAIHTPEIETIKMEIKNNQMDYSDIPIVELELPENIDLSNPNEILTIIPNSKDFNHSWSWRTALFCITNGLSCNDFLSWYKKKSDHKHNLNKWKNIHWKRIIEIKDQYPVSIKSMLKTLQLYYPNILVDPELKIFANSFNIDKNNIQYTDYLTTKDFETNKKAVIVNIQMGGGKTHNTIEYLKNNSNFCWITPNIALAENTHNRIVTNNIECINYKDGSNSGEKQKNIANAYNLIICLNSLKYVKQTYDVLVIDEIETFLKLWFNNSTLDRCLNECWYKFIQLIKKAKKIVLLDAFLTKMTTNFLDNLGIDYTIIKKTNEVNPRKVFKYSNFETITNKIIGDLKDGKKCLIFYPYKNEQERKKLPSMASYVNLIENKTDKKGIYHNADASDASNKLLKNVNDNWINYDFVISNNKINVGLNFDNQYFDQVYLMIAGFNSPRDIVQFSYRTRVIEDNILNYCFLDTYNPVIDVLKENVEIENDIYHKLFESVLIEKRSPVESTLIFFLTKANYTIIDGCNDILTDEKMEFDNMDYYDYDKLENINIIEADSLVRKMCIMEANILDKLLLKKYYYNKIFIPDTPREVMSELWNNRKVQFMQNCLNILYNNQVIDKLKKNYGWVLHFPEEIKENFKFDKNDLDLLFNQVDFKYLKKEKSKHNLILRNYLNTVYGVHLLTKNKKDSFYKVNDSLRDAYINIIDYHRSDLYITNNCVINSNLIECCL
jgi:phage pi2 protein 07